MPAGTRKEVRPGCAFVLAGVVIGAIVGAVAGAASYDPSEDFFDFGQGFSAFAGGALGSLAGTGELPLRAEPAGSVFRLGPHDHDQARAAPARGAAARGRAPRRLCRGAA